MEPLEIISLVLFLADAANKGITVAQEGKAKLEEIIAEGRDPTPAEWAEVRNVTEKLHREIQAA